MKWTTVASSVRTKWISHSSFVDDVDHTHLLRTKLITILSCGRNFSWITILSRSTYWIVILSGRRSRSQFSLSVHVQEQFTDRPSSPLTQKCNRKWLSPWHCWFFGLSCLLASPLFVSFLELGLSVFLIVLVSVLLQVVSLGFLDVVL